MSEESPYGPPPAPPPGQPPIPPMPPLGTTATSSLSVASLVLGILSFLCCGPVFSIPAIVCGHMALGQVRRGEASESSRGMAIAALVLGYINVVLFVLFILFYAVLIGFAILGETLS